MGKSITTYRELQQQMLDKREAEIDAQEEMNKLHNVSALRGTQYKRACLATDKAYWDTGGNASEEYKKAACAEADSRRLLQYATQAVDKHYNAMRGK